MSTDRHYDVVVIGAGFSGLYALHKLRAQGLRILLLEKADAVGGTWLVNRYPGARCDIESIEYSYSFSDEIQQEWVWTESMPAQPEIEAYLNFVADRLDLRRDIAFGAEVVAMTFDEAGSRWHLDTAEFRELFDRRAILASGWYAQRLASKQSAEVALVKRGIADLGPFVRNAGNVEPVGRLGLDSRLTQLQERLALVSSPSFLKMLNGTLGRQVNFG